VTLKSISLDHRLEDIKNFRLRDGFYDKDESAKRNKRRTRKTDLGKFCLAFGRNSHLREA
jgi:hypothetical protein